MLEARAKSPPSKFRIRSGRTGAMIPKAIMSNATMMRIKPNAARPVPEPAEGSEGLEVGSAINSPGPQISRMTGRINGRLEVCLFM